MTTRCCYHNTISEFLSEDRRNWQDSMTNTFDSCVDLPLGESQKEAWVDCFKVLQEELPPIAQKHPEFEIIFEYTLPYESGRRPDVILLSNEYVIILEFKQKTTPLDVDLDQTAAYMRDIREYHYESRDKTVKAILVLTRTTDFNGVPAKNDVLITSKTHLANTIESVIETKVTRCDTESWLNSRYEPLPTIVEAARMFMEHEKLPDIKRYNSTGIPQALEYLRELTTEARSTHDHVIAFVTGVPGAGKTFLGLRFVYEVLDSPSKSNSVYLSGNGPLIEVLSDALKSKVFVKDLHKVVQQYLKDSAPDFSNNIIVFDEGQRAWDKDQMSLKRNSSMSEPEVIVRLCSERLDWCILLVLVGEGQEINKGENAGIKQWEDALHATDVKWKLVYPEKLDSLFPDHISMGGLIRNNLDLSVSLRTHAASDVSLFVNALIDGDINKSRNISDDLIKEGYVMYITRDLETAKNHVRERYRNEPMKKYGLMASSKSRILPQYGMDNSFYATTKYGVNGPWFNAPRDDPRSCCALNRTITEFGCQGLEIDMPIIGWESDMTWNKTSWNLFKPKEKSDSDQNTYRKNSYRVLLTRGRDGFIIFVPADERLNSTFDILIQAGIKCI